MIAEPAAVKNGFFSRLDDRINPIVVKELRQAVQSRFVSTALIALLTIQLTAFGVYLLSSGESLLEYNAGRNVFFMLFAILLGVSLLFVPAYTATRLTAERSDANVDLLFITTLKPESIISGKMLAAMTIEILIFSACMPFVLFTYFLRGVDLPTILISLAYGFLVVVVCTQIAVFVACAPINRAFKTVLGVLALIFIVIVYFALMSWVGRIAYRGFSRPSNFWKEIAVTIAISAVIIGLFFTLSTALIKPIASNRALNVRLFITIAWLALGASAMIASVLEQHHGPVTTWNLLFLIPIATSFFAAVSERDSYGRRLRQSVPRSTFRRAISFLFYSGAANGLVWAAGMICLTLGLVWIWVKLSPTRSGVSGLVESAKWMGGMSLYFFAYALSGALLRRYIFKMIPTAYTWVFGAMLLSLGSIAPMLIGYLFFFNDPGASPDFSRWFVGNPFAWDYRGHRVFFAVVGGVFAGLATALSIPWFIERWKQFKPDSDSPNG
jgi:hypothetical protein